MPDASSLTQRVWYGRGGTSTLTRVLLAPLEAAYRGGVRVRAAMFDVGALAAHRPPAPAISVGNLTVGGTGKTPVAAWIARTLRDRGAHPAIVMRGYGGDEPLVHARLNPDVPVVCDADRLKGAQRAVSGGADCLVLDDAFQHRRLARVADVVLVSADRWDGRVRLLPAGPWRESLTGLRRATLVLVTRKSVELSWARSVAADLARHTSAPVGVVSLALEALVAGEAEMPLTQLAGRRVLAIAAVGDAGAFGRQLEELGAVVRTAFFRDHHRFTADEARRLSAGLDEEEWAVCTLKDYVKLAHLWPAASSAFWYVSQRVAPESGEMAIEQVLDSVLRAREPSLTSTGRPEPA